jgi:serine/threonine protein kinase
MKIPLKEACTGFLACQSAFNPASTRNGDRRGIKAGATTIDGSWIDPVNHAHSTTRHHRMEMSSDAYRSQPGGTPRFDQPGNVLDTISDKDGRYHIQVDGHLGSGRHANVLHGVDTNTGQEVAIKVSAEGFKGTVEYEFEFLTELLSQSGENRDLQPIENEWIREGKEVMTAPLFATEFDGKDMMVLPVAGEKSLDQLLMAAYPPIIFSSESNRFVNDETLWTYDGLQSITKQLLTALLFLNARGYVHGDIKPDNIMLSNLGEHGRIIRKTKVKLIDYGLYTRVGTPVTLGAQYYMPPEYWKASLETAPPASMSHDMFGLGMTLLDLMTNHETPREKLANYIISVKEPILLHSLIMSMVVPRAPIRNENQLNELVSFVAQCLSADPQERLTPVAGLYHPFMHGFTIENWWTRLARPS